MAAAFAAGCHPCAGGCGDPVPWSRRYCNKSRCRLIQTDEACGRGGGYTEESEADSEMDGALNPGGPSPESDEESDEESDDEDSDEESDDDSDDESESESESGESGDDDDDDDEHAVAQHRAQQPPPPSAFRSVGTRASILLPSRAFSLLPKGGFARGSPVYVRDKGHWAPMIVVGRSSASANSGRPLRYHVRPSGIAGRAHDLRNVRWNHVQPRPAGELAAKLTGRLPRSKKLSPPKHWLRDGGGSGGGGGGGSSGSGGGGSGDDDEHAVAQHRAQTPPPGHRKHKRKRSPATSSSMVEALLAGTVARLPPRARAAVATSARRCSARAHHGRRTPRWDALLCAGETYLLQDAHSGGWREVKVVRPGVERVQVQFVRGGRPVTVAAKEVRARFRLPGTVSRRTGRRTGLWYACARQEGAPCVCNGNGGGLAYDAREPVRVGDPLPLLYCADHRPAGIPAGMFVHISRDQVQKVLGR